MDELNLSIIVPMYNSRDTIERCLKSIFAQSSEVKFEVIVVDDASTDDSPALAKKFPVNLVSLKNNLGAGSARNRGAREAKGEVLVFVDSDVELEHGSLKRIENFFKNNPDYAAVVGNYTVLPSAKNICAVYHNFFTVYHHDLSSGDIEWFWGALSAIRKNIFEQLSGFREQYPGASAEDIELGYRLSESGFKIKYLPELRGAHSRKFGLANMLYNDYHKSVLGLKLYLKRKPRGKHPHGFSNTINGVNTILAPLSLLSLIALPWLWFLPAILITLIFFVINFRFYLFILNHSGFKYFFPSVFLHWLSFNVIALGVFAGLIGVLLGKGLESRSRWI